MKIAIVAALTKEISYYLDEITDLEASQQAGVKIWRGHYQGHELAIDFSADTAVAHFRVHGISKVNRGGTCRKRNHVAFRRKRKYLVGREIIA